MRLLITDITEMHQGNYCVAGWCPEENRMIRPLPAGSNWTGPLLAAHNIVGGTTIQIVPNGNHPNSPYPHRTEDTPIYLGNIAPGAAFAPIWFGGHPPSASTLEEAFEDNVQTTGSWNGAKKGAFVQEGSQIGSLAAVKINTGNLEFFEDNYNGKKSLRAYLTDEDECYSLPVVGRRLREIYRAEDVDHLNEQLPTAGQLHVRVGLARAWPGQPGKCTIMINGIYW